MGRTLTTARGGSETSGPVRASPPFRRILLVGFMGSGKSTVGSLLADALEWEYADADDVVEASAGRSIAEIFRVDGEARFRELEHQVTTGLLEREDLVIATGGGWPCRPGRLSSLPAGTLSVWLRVEVDRILERLGGDETCRPLLEVDDPRARVDELLTERAPFYELAHWSVDTETHTPKDIVRELLGRLRTDEERLPEL